MVITTKNDEKKTFEINKNESLLSLLIREGLFTSSICGGKGTCGKCKVKVTGSSIPISASDKLFFSEKELDEGWRLSCTLFPTDDLSIYIPSNDESGFEILTQHRTFSPDFTDSSYSILIDIGTTTVVFELVYNGEIIVTKAFSNSQRAFGADVITRIKESISGRRNRLKECIREDLKCGILSLCEDANIPLPEISKCIISCNTTMTYLLMGYDCTPLSAYPFNITETEFIKTTLRDLLGLQTNCTVTIIPPISAFVGGDIVSGLFALDFDTSKEISLLIDLGTNGEIALGNCEKILTTSTAAGPAFEGGNIKNGMASISGAICSVEINGSVRIKTINSLPPEGICGTGVIEIVSEMLKSGIIDETGLLENEYFSKGFPVCKNSDGEDILFTQKDIRELQLAKSAVRAGIETLINLYGIEKSDISKVYIAGGFGYNLDVKKAVSIGLFPKEFLSRVEFVGNSSLSGCMKLLTQSDNGINHIKSISKEINLSLDENFNDLYMEEMFFPMD